jgi:quercetin dioxygenase-like cupin family protein
MGTTKATHSKALLTAQSIVTLHKDHIMVEYLGQVSSEFRAVATTIASLQIPPIHNHEHFETAFVLRDPTNS